MLEHLLNYHLKNLRFNLLVHPCWYFVFSDIGSLAYFIVQIFPLIVFDPNVRLLVRISEFSS